MGVQCYMLCSCVYGLHQDGHLNNSFSLCILFSFVMKFKNRCYFCLQSGFVNVINVCVCVCV